MSPAPTPNAVRNSPRPPPHPHPPRGRGRALCPTCCSIKAARTRLTQRSVEPARTAQSPPEPAPVRAYALLDHIDGPDRWTGPLGQPIRPSPSKHRITAVQYLGRIPRRVGSTQSVRRASPILSSSVPVTAMPARNMGFVAQQRCFVRETDTLFQVRWSGRPSRLQLGRFRSGRPPPYRNRQ